MLKTATVREISTGLVTKRQGHLVLVTRYYPRGLARTTVHEYISDLAPPVALLKEFKAMAKKTGHNEAFKYVRYNQRFTLKPEGVEELKRLAELSVRKDVYLICHCEHAQCCHRELLLLAAQALFQAPTDRVKRSYPGFDPARSETSERID